MRRLITSATLVATLAAGCAESEPVEQPSVVEEIEATTTTEAAPTSTTKPEVEEATSLAEQLADLGYEQRSDAVYGDYFVANYGDEEIARVQEFFGLRANQWLIEADPIDVEVDGVTYSASFRPPSKDALRTIGLVPELSDISSVVGEGFVGPVSLMQYDINDEGDPILLLSTGAVHQDLADARYAGPFGSMAVEMCQPTDMTLSGPWSFEDDPQLDTYRAAKEGVCNTLGAAIDKLSLGEDYEAYRNTIDGLLISDNAAGGREIPYPVLSEEQFLSLSDRVSS